MKLKLTSLLVAMLFTVGVHAADSARKDGVSASSTVTNGETAGKGILAGTDGQGIFWMAMSYVFAITDSDVALIWTTKNMTPEVLARILTGGNIVEWGNLQEYRAGRLALLARYPDAITQPAYQRLNAITDDAGIRWWAIREANAIYIQAMMRPQSNPYGQATKDGHPFITDEDYFDSWRPTVYSYGLMANNVECAMADKVKPDEPGYIKLAAKLVEAFLDLPDSAFAAPVLTEICAPGTSDCQPSHADDSMLMASIAGVTFVTNSEGVTISTNGKTKLFGKGYVCGRKWKYTQEQTKATSTKPAKAKTKTKGDDISTRKQVAPPKE